MSTETEVVKEKKTEQNQSSESVRSEGARSEGNRPDRQYSGHRRYFQSRRKVCRFCKNTVTMNYRSPDSLKRFITELGKILPRRITGTCAKHQRRLALTVKHSRMLALLPFVGK